MEGNLEFKTSFFAPSVHTADPLCLNTGEPGFRLSLLECTASWDCSPYTHSRVGKNAVTEDKPGGPLGSTKKDSPRRCPSRPAECHPARGNLRATRQAGVARIIFKMSSHEGTEARRGEVARAGSHSSWPGCWSRPAPVGMRADRSGVRRRAPSGRVGDVTFSGERVPGRGSRRPRGGAISKTDGFPLRVANRLPFLSWLS